MKRELIIRLLKAGVTVLFKGNKYKYDGEKVIKGDMKYSLDEAVKELSK